MAQINSDINYDSSIIFSGNLAIYDSTTDTEYVEGDELFTEIDNSLEFAILDELDSIWSLYNRKGDEIDLYPFDSDDILCYVNIENGNSNQNGLSWNRAYNDLQDCLDLLASTGGEIWVKGGIEPYIPLSIPFIKQGIQARHRSFYIYANTRIYGGFGGSETSRESRDFDTYPTTLSGNYSSSEGRVDNIILAEDNVLIDGFIFQEAGCENISESNSGTGIYYTSTNINSSIIIVNSIFIQLCSTGVGKYTLYTFKSYKQINL